MKKNPLFPGPVGLAFLISICYWAWLVMTTRMGIVWDAVNYESLGKMLAGEGWVEFFKTGPHREPFYPALVAVSFILEKIFGISYQFFQSLIQLGFLLLTQVLVLRILRVLEINSLISALVVLYLGISPAIVNSALSLYSEIATYPFILAAVLLVYKSRFYFSVSNPRLKICAVLTGLLFAVLILNKAIFELVTLAFFLFLSISMFFARSREFNINFFKYLIITLTVFYLLSGGYKSLNKIFNGQFVITDRGAWMLYGSTARKLEPLTGQRFLTALAFIPGKGICESAFGKEKCSFWSFEKSDWYGILKANELKSKNMKPAAVDRSLLLLAGQKILQNPVQYALLTGLEGVKMFFWESTQIGFVAYPGFLTSIFSWTPFKNGLRLTVSFLTIFSVVYSSFLIWRRRAEVMREDNPLFLLYLCLLFIFSFISSYSLVHILTRYSLPLAPLYLIVIAYVTQRIFFLRPAKK